MWVLYSRGHAYRYTGSSAKEVFEVASGNVVSVRHERAILVELGVTPVELIDCGGFPECLDYQRPADTNQTL